ncbi:hypothetical protein F5Y04DRAFT_292983 [Hypomontagnella monticulosa]|nr:hypothetical protein F5Y04DRAFT_292983 [Hypomontagnella monticulosa]
MPPRKSQSSAEEYLLPFDGRSPSNPYFTAYRQARHFWKRTLALTLFPLGMTAYYFFIYIRYNRSPDDPVRYGDAGEIWIFYSWFVISVFALEWSKYGLAGAEAAMLQTSFWQAPNTVGLLMHSENLWSGPDGWWKFLWRLVWPQKRLVHRLWSLLAFLSLFAFVAVPLSGLSFEISDGYIPSSSAPMVIGHTWEDFNRRQEMFYYDGAQAGWDTGSPATIPGFGVLYTPEYLDRQQYGGFSSIPNALPLAEGIPEIFLAPQASTPVSGKAWGLHAAYNCSMVKDASEFTILSQKYSAPSGLRHGLNPDTPDWVMLDTPSPQQVIYAFSTLPSPRATNLWAYAEMGISNWSATAYDGSEPSSIDQDGLAKADILEYSLWQARLEGSYGDNYTDFNSTLDPFIKGIGQPIIQVSNGSFVINGSFFTIPNENVRKNIYNESAFIEPYMLERTISVASPIGIRCRFASTLGTAELNPKQSTFHSYEQTPSPPFNNSEEETMTPRLGNIAHTTLLAQYSQIFIATNSPAPITASNSYLYRNFVQPQMLQKAIMLAYAMDALQLMYDGIYGFEGAWSNPNLTSSIKGKVLVAGVIPQWIPAMCFAIWAIGSLLLGLLYGFRRRWSDSLDGYSFLRFGVELANDLKGKPDFMSASEFHHSKTLESLPGVIGDMRNNGRNGYQSVELRKRNLGSN